MSVGRFKNSQSQAAGPDVGEAPLFRTTGRFTRIPHRMTQPDAYPMIQRRTRRAGVKTLIGNHSLRATGITDYLKNQGTLEGVQVMVNHSSPRTTKLYDRRNDETSLDEYEKVRI
ncbi:MAG: tyrosine-type recombinase/integrase [Terriglobia bacterium]